MTPIVFSKSWMPSKMSTLNPKTSKRLACSDGRNVRRITRYTRFEHFTKAALLERYSSVQTTQPQKRTFTLLKS